jgi:HK97 family phage portal protein
VSLLSYFRRAFGLHVQPASTPVSIGFVPSGERVDTGDVLALSAAYACTRLIAGTIGSLPVQVLKSEGVDGTPVPARDHWAYRLLHDSPNDELTPFEFFEGVGASIELKGNALALKDRTGERTSALIPVRWDDVQVRRLGDGRIEYEHRGEKYGPDEVLHLRGFGGDALGGLSTIAVAAGTFGLAKAIDRSAGALFRNGIRTSLALAAEHDLQPEQIEELARRIEEKWAGAMNAGRPLVLNSGLKAVQLSMNADDAQLLESRGFTVEEVCRFFGVPPFMVGHHEKTTSWGSGVEQAVLGFQKFTMAPRLKRVEQALMKQLLTPADRAAGIRIEFNVEGLLRAASKERADFYTAAINAGWMSRNEVRRKENLPPIDGGDKITVQMQQVPLGGQAQGQEPKA